MGVFYFKLQRKYGLHRYNNSRSKTIKEVKKQGHVKMHKNPKCMYELNKVTSCAESSVANC